MFINVIRSLRGEAQAKSTQELILSTFVVYQTASIIMRESNNYNMIPLPRDNMNVVIGSTNFLTNVSSNGYYGYQPQLQVQKKECSEAYSVPQAAIGNDNNIAKMEIQYCFQESYDMQTEHDTRDQSRKRRCCYDEIRDFKKKRQNESNLKHDAGMYDISHHLLL